ncbi:ABC transporter permease [Roseateles saccharophilus]|uniref:Cu-processing system permease protein n=1 Tax=Roseateles saccharophilus TaxID=304 RepID=A0A4R3VCD5_ROSSA|nr:ABC transporter permease [Roseateles saccharophilus]MDG0831750.1 ABC transporter permease [Roseateles saccharophilus]TCV01229.1 Cu-processing system permease protein [Roseateles saccharophilus]
MIHLQMIGALAGKEFRDRLRNRWALVAALLFTVFSMAIAYFGGAQQGQVGLRSVEVTVTSLVSLAIYLVPLMALLLGYDAIVGERERGSLDLLLALPITRLELLLGKYLGLAAALLAASFAGFSIVGVLVYRAFAWAGLFHYLGFMLSSALLGLAFLSLAMLLSVVARERARASGVAMVLWFGFVLVFDLLLLGLLVASSGQLGAWLSGDVLGYVLLLNPTDVFRILNMFSMEDMRGLYGLASVVPDALMRPGVLTAAMLGWIVAPLLLAAWKFRSSSSC